VGVTACIITESSSKPLASDPWIAVTSTTSYSTTSASYSAATPGAKTLYAWARDAAGNVSTSRSAPVTITATIDGAALYGTNCASCHGLLASSTKKGKNAGQIQGAIDADTGGMGSLKSLTPDQVAAIATALASETPPLPTPPTLPPSPDATPPEVTSFVIPSTSGSLTVPIQSLTATDNVGVTGYLITELSTSPSASDPAWSPIPPPSYPCATGGMRTLYAWARDAAGNVSQNQRASVTIIPAGPAEDMSVWIGKWFNLTERDSGYYKDTGEVLNKESFTQVEYLKFWNWDPVSKTFHADRYWQDANSGQWISEPIILNYLAGSKFDFLCWSQMTSDFTFVFTARIQGRETKGVLGRATFKTLGGYYIDSSSASRNKAASSEQNAGGLSISGNLISEPNLPVPDEAIIH
jgi:mono/diheme cytochrome c family protein